MQTKNANTSYQPIQGKRPVILEIRDSRTKQMVNTTIYVDLQDTRSNEEIRKSFKRGRKAQITDKRNFNKATKLANFNKTFDLPTSKKLTGNGAIILPEDKRDMQSANAIKSLFYK